MEEAFSEFVRDEKQAHNCTRKICKKRPLADHQRICGIILKKMYENIG